MNVQIPIAGLTLTDGDTYDGQLPVWATRPLMIRVLPDFISSVEYPVYIRVSNGGAIKKEIVLPYQEVLYLDLSFAAPLLTRADRNNSETIPQQLVEIWSADEDKAITLPVFHCDETYWDTLGVDAALPQPIKPRIPGQTLDIYFPYRVHQLDAFPVKVEPVTGAPSSVIFPTTYVLGNTIDIANIKKLTIKNVWGSGLDQVINYEDRLMSDAVNDKSLQCALRARWNMRNGQWFWDAFKDYFWSNKFTPIRGRGGVTEQAELTVNLEYGEEYYNVYQELLVSSNIVFDLNIPGINQYQSKRFRAEVVGDTGARWSNSTKTYRQQVRFKTTELQDNYMFPLAPDQPPTPSIAFSAQYNPWTVGAAYAEGLTNSIYSNAAWEVQSEPSWFSVTNGTTLLTPDDFEQGGANVAGGVSWDAVKNNDARFVRSKQLYSTLGEVYSIISRITGYEVIFVYLNSSGVITGGGDRVAINGRVNTGAGNKIGILLNRADLADMSPSEVSAINAYWGKRYHQFPADNIYLSGIVAGNTGEARTGNLVLKSKAGSTTYTIPITQQKASISFDSTEVIISADSAPLKLVNHMHPTTDWVCVEYPTWGVPLDLTGVAKPDIHINLNVQANTGAPRSANLTYRSAINPSVQTSFRLVQAGATGNIDASPSTFNVGYVTLPVTTTVTSIGNWILDDIDANLTASVTSGGNGNTSVTFTVADNTSNSPRTLIATLQNVITSDLLTIAIVQAGAPSSIGITPTKVTGPKEGATAIATIYVSHNSWIMGSAPSWVFVAPTSGGAGSGTIGVGFDQPNNTGAKRSGYLRLENTTTHEIAICIIEQEG